MSYLQLVFSRTPCDLTLEQFITTQSRNGAMNAHWTLQCATTAGATDHLERLELIHVLMYRVCAVWPEHDCGPAGIMSCGSELVQSMKGTWKATAHIRRKPDVGAGGHRQILFNVIRAFANDECKGVSRSAFGRNVFCRKLFFITFKL